MKQKLFKIAGFAIGATTIILSVPMTVAAAVFYTGRHYGKWVSELLINKE